MILFNLSCVVGQAYDHFGMSVAGIGDVDLDGRNDMMVGACHADPNGESSGRVLVFSSVTGSAILSIDGSVAGDELGSAIAGVGDLNEDSYSDILLGAHCNDSTGPDAGAGYLYYLGDFDRDGYVHSCDNCALVFNPDQADSNGDGVGDVCDWFCGDCDDDGLVDIDDAVFMLLYIFSDGPPPVPLEAADIDCSGVVDIDDVVYFISYIFSGENSPCDTDGDGVPDC